MHIGKSRFARELRRQIGDVESHDELFGGKQSWCGCNKPGPLLRVTHIKYALLAGLEKHAMFWWCSDVNPMTNVYCAGAVYILDFNRGGDAITSMDSTLDAATILGIRLAAKYWLR